jgi:cob(I)alamin adenosyltransferase
MGEPKCVPGRGGPKQGLVIVHTGDGKGKSTAAFGTLLRAWGRGMRVGVVQFMKASTGRWGEVRAGEQLGIDWIKSGEGFTWMSDDLDEAAARAEHGWSRAQEMIRDGGYDLLLLDEFTYPFHYGWMEIDPVLAWLRDNKPQMLHLIITGRHAPVELLDFADLVTEMRAVKHPLRDQGIRAQPGVEY